MSTQAEYHVAFPAWYDERGEWEAEVKGWLQGVEVRLAGGDVQPLFFYDPVRLAQDLEAEKHENSFVASPSLIVIPKITRATILSAIDRLVREGYFPIRSAGRCDLVNVLHDTSTAAVA